MPCVQSGRDISLCISMKTFLKTGCFNINESFFFRHLFLCTYKNIIQSTLFPQQMNSKDYFYPLLIYGQVPTEPQSCLRTCTQSFVYRAKVLLAVLL